MKTKKRPQPLTFTDHPFAEGAPPPAPREHGNLDLAAMPQGQQPATAAPRPVAALRAPEAGGADARNGSRFTYLYLVATAASLLWAGGLAAYALGYRSHLGPFENEPFTAAVLAVLALAPVGLIWIAAFALRQSARLLSEADRLQALSDRMVAPAAMAAAQAGSAVEAIRLEIESAAAAADLARDQLLQLRQGLSEETGRLLETASGAARDAALLVHSLGREREQFSLLSGKLDNQAGEITDAISRHARMMAEASDLAQAQIHEAEAALAARAADLAAAAGEATETARTAGDDLSRQAARLEAAGTTVGEQVQVVEDSLGQQRAALVTLAHALRTEQEDLAVHFESQRAQLTEILRHSEQGVAQIGDAAGRGARTLADLIAHAADQLSLIGEQAQAERDLLGGAALQSLGAFSEAAAFERRALEDQTHRAIGDLATAAETAHKAAELSGAAARLKVEQLSEAAFAAGQKADQAFETRLSEARGLIERSAQLVDDAGARSAQRLETAVEAAQSTLDQLQTRLLEIETRSTALPAEAQARGVEIKTALDETTAALLDSARTAARELEAIDSAFQERVRRNYEMLSEAVRLMGVLGGGAAARAGGGGALKPSLDPLLARNRSSEAQGGPRTRLKLTPTAMDADISTVFEGPPDRSVPADPDAWTWKELLSGLDEDQADDSEMERALIAEVEALGVDTAALMPRLSLEAVAGAFEAGDPEGARDVVRGLAPAAIRKLARRVLSDKLMRAQADRFVGRYAARLTDEARQEDEPILGQLASDAGRTFLLLDAAVGDLT